MRKHNLILNRKQGESVVVQCGEETLSVQVLELDPKEVRLLFRAPPSISIDRLERYNARVAAEEEESL